MYAISTFVKIYIFPPVITTILVSVLPQHPLFSFSTLLSIKKYIFVYQDDNIVREELEIKYEMQNAEEISK